MNYAQATTNLQYCHHYLFVKYESINTDTKQNNGNEETISQCHSLGELGPRGAVDGSNPAQMLQAGLEREKTPPSPSYNRHHLIQSG